MNNNIEMPLDNDKFKEVLKKIDDHLLKVKKPSLLITSAQMSQTIIHSGIQALYKDKIEFIHTLVSPYCYVPVTEVEKALKIVQDRGNILVIKEPALKLKGLNSTLLQAKEDGANIEVVNREIDALDIAINNKDKQVIFFSVDYEANSPSLAGLVLEASYKKVSNISILVHNRMLPPAVRNFLEVSKKVDAYIAPGDLTILVGMQAWDFMPNDYNIPVSIGGFNSLSLLKSIEAVLNMLVNNYYSVINNYTDLVNRHGNPLAQEKTYKVFSPKTIEWQGFGLIPFSGLCLNTDYTSYDANERFEIASLKSSKQNPCNEVLKGIKHPTDCEHFNTSCTPQSPLGCSMNLQNGICNVMFEAGSIKIPDIKDYKEIIK